jgi:MurNAc alpha-1-phosphate uridylyltransferase
VKRPHNAMMLAAGLGTRMRPLTDHMPKPLVTVGGKALIDRGLDALADAGVKQVVVNVHYLPEMLIGHLREREKPRIIISDERGDLLDSGGGIAKALPIFGGEPFYVLNADTFWIDREASNLERLALKWDAARMDILILLADTRHATGHTGKLDFVMDAEGKLRRAIGGSDGYIYAGAAILHPRVFDDAPSGSHSLNLHFDRAIAAGRMFGLVLEGHWLTVGTQDAIEPAEDVLQRLNRVP